MKEMRLALALPFILGLAAPMAAESLEQAVSQIVSRLTSAGLARSATLTFRNLSSLPAVQADEVRDAMAASLAKAGVQPGAGQPEIRLTLSESIRGLLLVAEFGDHVTIVPWTRSLPAPAQPRYALKVTPILEQPTPILDFLLADSGKTLVVLESGRVGSYRRSNTQEWTASHAVILNLTRPMPRDPRGRLEGKPDDFRVSVPGSLCTGAVAPTPRAGNCTADQTWAADRNYFESSRGPYFTSARAGAKTLLAHLDRRTRLWGEGSQPKAVVEGWGSDVASMQSCSANPTVLATAAGNNEALEAFEIAGDDLTSVSDPVRLPGPVTALWPSETPGEVSVVVRNQKTGVYEASRVAIACAE